jgi:ribonucleoside-diphosphate reductase alpha chain
MLMTAFIYWKGKTTLTTILKDEREGLSFDEERLGRFMENIMTDFPHLSVAPVVEKVSRRISAREEFRAEQITKELVLSTTELIGVKQTEEDDMHPDWTFVTARLFLKELYKQVGRRRGYANQSYGDFFGLLKVLGDKGIYDQNLLKKYTEEEIREFGEMIVPERDNLFTYIGVSTLAGRYLATDHDRNVYELPQERFMVIAMTLLQDEQFNRTQLIEQAYFAMSNLYMTVATPTLANAGKSYGQLSSCFIDTIEDDLRAIYDSNTDVATLSKDGGGIGVYMGKVRSLGSAIRGFKGASSGIIPWMKQLNNTAVSVDQLGQRNGAVAIYVDVWTKDIFSFLDAKLNNGDERKRTHDIFTGVCIPDLFMEQVENRGDWYLFDPHEARTVMGWSIEDYYDETKGSGSFREKYWEIVDSPDVHTQRVPAIDVFKRILISQLETGTPYMFYRDTVNRGNANAHKGMIYCSNLCTEIAQNMSPTTIVQEELVGEDEETYIVTTKKPGDFVVCNLSSLNLARAVKDGVLDKVIPIQVRMLDNVIELNDIKVLQAKLTNNRYRGIGLGTFGWHHLLALEGIKWESEEAVNYADTLYEAIAYLTISASNDLAIEKGSYKYFEGSDWETGEYFEKRGYTGKRWEDLRFLVSSTGIRNGYLMAVAPNASTSVIAGSTASIDPLFRKEYSEEKSDYKIPVTAPDISPETFWYYKTAYNIDQSWSIRQNAKRQRHVDQAISFNLYVNPDIKAKDLLDLHMLAWKSDMKTTYYTRSRSQAEIDECESCHS